MSRRRKTCRASSSTSMPSSAPPSRSSSTTWAWSCTSPTGWPCWTTGARSPTARPSRCARTRRCSTPISGRAMTEILYAVFAGPFREMAGSPAFLVEVLLGGVATGLMYSLVALGFVLIFKASGVFNFAQGVMVLFAALTLARLTDEIDNREVYLAHFVVVASLLGVAVASVLWWTWREYVARGAGGNE